ncbi:MAG: Re/Si-specific NAD(P)(+) transhydrogenase subunit alpha [Planctomycetaceae bacterium]|nr:Re/Si-specific NAD(P)(+) transhydrogenase subunit alpha [Planctomycetaceae bacterium]MCP4464371.1 Re/Si-specific NAD(P)(+) transhydrogenase subunit alpha [Planctomycetaceae bacterium]MDG1808761.1 Re/Si-specific NAD(P)(+) transhydrogenase subunit alpha [Pirellulaceae bacterium]MDG2105076.1 Re/Si-specific NAD(P)(+) transhydrogenase subunit alpha [Pirellulaceae bacterium]
MLVAIPREKNPEECRVAATPASVKKIIALGYDVLVEKGCGERANYLDDQYADAGAQVQSDSQAVWGSADVILTVAPPSTEDLDRIKSGAVLIGFLWPAKNKDLLDALKTRNISALAMDCVPRISRAQKMDALSSMANIAGYRAVIEAANHFGSFFTGQITAAGKVPPAKVLVIGAGVAGLSAIGTAKGLGAIVRAFDTRLAVKDQVKSMGADFLELEFEESGEGTGGYAKVMSDEFIRVEMELFAQQAKEVDIIVTTALIPNKPAPKLVTAAMVESMKPGSVIVDLAAENGGNCELTQHGKVVREHDVTIIGFSDFPSRLPTQSSALYGNNIVNLLTDMTPEKDGQLSINLEDQVVRGALVTHDGGVTWPPPRIEPSPTPKPQPEVPTVSQEPVTIPGEQRPEPFMQKWGMTLFVGAAMLLMLWLLGQFAPKSFMPQITVFALACFVGWQLVWNVTPALHTPLMSVTNAISGIIVLGAILQMQGSFKLATVFAFVAVLLATINIAGGFYVTQRMLSMFRKQD